MALDKSDKNITVMIARPFADIEVSEPAVTKLITTICSRFDVTDAAISIAVVGDAEIQKVNKRFLDRDRTTDCISFDLSDSESETQSPGEAGKLFDLVVNGEKAMREAEQRGHSPQAELALYLVHGMLHNLGFDDGTDSDAGRIHAVEDEILEQLGYGRVYQDDSNLSSGDVMPN